MGGWKCDVGVDVDVDVVSSVCVWRRGESERREKRLLLMAASRWKRSVVLGTWKLSINM